MVCYSIIDEQSNSSFIDASVTAALNVSGLKTDYTLTTMSGFSCKSSGFLVEGLQIRGFNSRKSYKLSHLLTSNSIPDCKHEVASPGIVELHPHIAHLSRHFLEVAPSAEVLLLLGRDCGDLMKTKCYGQHVPFAYETPLGWALVGGVCPVDISKKLVLKTNHEHLDAHQRFVELPRLVGPTGLFTESKTDDLSRSFQR